eukprot:14969746-Alexandrium_andersonii.AAC.1
MHRGKLVSSSLVRCAMNLTATRAGGGAHGVDPARWKLQNADPHARETGRIAHCLQRLALELRGLRPSPSRREGRLARWACWNRGFLRL